MIMSHDSTSKESQSKDVSRRTLLKTTAVAATSVGLGANALAYLAPNRNEGVAKKSASANDKIVFGLIGCGGMGAANMRNFMQPEDVEVAALCDVDENRIPGDFKAVESKYGRKPTVYDDYRKMLERKDIDASFCEYSVIYVKICLARVR